MEDGKKLKMLKRHLKTAYNMTPEEYREKWNLPSDYPMVAPNYAEKRRELAASLGVPPYVIFHDATLREFTLQRPANLTDMSSITGVGKKKLDAYGDDFLAVIRQF